MSCPSSLVAGDSLNFLTSVPDYPATDAWVLTYRLVPRTASNTVVVFSAAAEGADYRVQVSRAVTAVWAADSYTWASYVQKGNERVTLESGQIVVTPDPASAVAGYDGRSQAQKAVDDLEAALASFNASNGKVRRYRIADREMEFNTAADILMRLRFWQDKLEQEKLCAHLDGGGKPRNRILVRFTRPR